MCVHQMHVRQMCQQSVIVYFARNKQKTLTVVTLLYVRFVIKCCYV